MEEHSYAVLSILMQTLKKYCELFSIG